MALKMQENLLKNGFENLTFKYDRSEDKNHIALIFAVLERAIYDYVGTDGLTGSFISDNRQRIQIRNDAKKWMLSEDEDFFSFLWICSFLELCPARVRKSVFNQDPTTWKKMKTRGTLRSTERFFAHLFGEDTEEYLLPLPKKREG